MKKCSIEGCDSPMWARTYCGTHYQRWRKRGYLGTAEREVKTHGHRRTPVYNSWDCMIQCCRNPKNPHYKNYGGRGIKVCAGWDNPKTGFPNFYEQLGERPSKLTLDRMDVNGNYSCGKCEECLENNWPMNCQWVTRREQNLNRRIVSKSGYIGVSSQGDKFIASISIDGKSKRLGTFDTAKEAGAAYMEAAKADIEKTKGL